MPRDNGPRLETLERCSLGPLAAGRKVKCLPGFASHDDRRAPSLALQESDAWQRRARDIGLAGAKAERLQRFDRLMMRMRRRKALHENRGVERQAVDLAETADQPDEIGTGQPCRPPRLPPPRAGSHEPRCEP